MIEAINQSEFGRRLKEIRYSLQAKKIKQSTMAEWMGVQLRVLQAYEHGKSWPGTDKICNLVKHLSENYPAKPISTDWLLLGIGTKFRQPEIQIAKQYAIAASLMVIDGIIEECSEEAAQLLGYTSEELVGQQSMDYLSRGSRQSVSDKISDDYEEPYFVVAESKHGQEVGLMVVGRNITFRNSPARFIQVRKLDADEMKTQELIQLLDDEPEATGLLTDYMKGRKATKTIHLQMEYAA